MTKGWGFKQPVAHGYDEKYSIELPDFPPFPAAELNTRNSDGLGNVIIDKFGRKFVKVRYVSTTAGYAGGLVTLAPAVLGAVEAANQTTNYKFTSSTSLNTRENMIQGWELGIMGSANGVDDTPGALAASTQASVLRPVASNTKSATPVITYSELRRDIMPGVEARDGNRMPVPTAGTATTFINSTNAVGFIRSPYDVIQCQGGANVMQDFPCGVLLGAVTAATTDGYEGDTMYYTWIQVYGPGLVAMKAAEACVINATLAIAATTWTDGALKLLISGPPSVLQMAMSIGVHLVTVTTGATHRALVPTFINPGYLKIA